MPSFEHLFALEGYQIETVQITDEHLTLLVTSGATAATCPLCAAESTSIRSRYTRALRDLPCAGRPVRFEVVVRRFRCLNPLCSRKYFAERFPTLTKPHAQRTNRLRAEQQAIGLALGGEAGARLSHHLHMATSPATLLRLVRQTALPARSTPKVLGVDDWSLRRGKTFGTILVDLEQHHPIDLLPDRKAETLAEWLKAHPGVDIITRDRSPTYAEGASTGAPSAIQVADRFHLVQNWGQMLEQVFNRHRPDLYTTSHADASVPSSPALLIERPALNAAQAQHRAQRQARYETIRGLYLKGMRLTEIARSLGIDWKTARKYAQADVFPGKPMGTPRRGSILRPYEPYLYQRFEEGCHDGVRLWREIVAQGYQGSRTLVAMYIAQLRRDARQQRVLARFDIDTMAIEEAATQTQQHYSPREVRYACICRAENRTTEQTALIEELRERGPELAEALAQTERFLSLIRERQGDQFDEWLHDALESPCKEIRQFAAHLRQDEAAVRAAVMLEWSNGQTEGQVNRLKMIKRTMYGRAKIDLLRQRVLAAA